MKALTLRNPPSEVVRMIQKKAKEKKTSLNQAVIQLLQEREGSAVKKEKKLYHDLDHLAGLWSKKEENTFNQTTSLQRPIDLELWK